MNQKKNRIISFLVVLITIVSIYSQVYAEGNLNSKLENVLVRLEDQSIVKLTMGDYGRAYSAKSSSDLYRFLLGNGEYIRLVGVSSGDKYITMGEYGRKFSGLKTKGGLESSELTSKAIENAAHSEDLSTSFSQIDDYKVEIIGFNVGSLISNINSNQVETLVPGIILNKSIKSLNFVFNKPVMITKINGEKVPQIFSDKMVRSGYSLDSFYEEYSFIIGDDYKYSMIFDIGVDSKRSVTTLTVVSQQGYERNIRIIFSRE